MEPWMFALPALFAVGLVPLAIRVRATRRLRHAVEVSWSRIADRWGLSHDGHRWYVALHFRGEHDGRMTRLIAFRSLLGNDVRSWRVWFAVIVELDSPNVRLAPTRTSGYIFGATESIVTMFRPTFARSLGVIPGKRAAEILPGVRYDGAAPELKPNIQAILESWFACGEGFVSDNGVCLAWNPETLPDTERVERALRDAKKLADWIDGVGS